MEVKTMRKVIQTSLILLMALALMLGLAQTAQAQPPSMPQAFYGTVTIDDNLAAAGTTVAVRVDGTQVKSITTNAEGSYACTVPGNSGAKVEFYVNGTKAQQTYTLSSGSVTNLNLSVGNATPPAPPPSTPPPPPPPAHTPTNTTPAPTTLQTTPTASTTTNTSSSTTAAIPASFTVYNLKISPASVKPGEMVTISATVTNNGGTSGSYNAVLMINDIEQAEKQVTLGPKQEQEISFTATQDTASIYKVVIGNADGSFEVSAVEATPPATTENKVPWLAIGGMAFGVLLMVFLVIVLIRRRSYYY